jgi:MFS family permease
MVSHRAVPIQSTHVGLFAAWWGGVLGNAYFNNVYGDLSVTQASGAVVHSLSSTQQSAGTALGQAGVAIGCLAGGWFADKVGRKNTFYWVSRFTESK